MKYLILSCLIAFSFSVKSQCSGYTLNLTSTDATCFGYCDGAINASTSGGNGGDIFTITDSSGAIIFLYGNTPNFLCTGWYYINVIDSLGCELNDSIFINQPGELAIDLTIIDNLLCFEDSIGLVTVDSVYNFQGSYNQIGYYWNPNPSGLNGIGENILNGALGGDYSLTINDEFGCSNVFYFTIGPSELIFSSIGFTPCTGGINGEVFCTVTGGTGNYTYTWTNLSDMSTTNNSTWSGLVPGDYMIQVVDDNGCVLTETITLGCVGIDEIEALNIIISGQENYVTIDIASIQTFYAEFYSLTGQLVKRKELVFGSGKIELPSGPYILILIDETGNIALESRKIIVY